MASSETFGSVKVVFDRYLTVNVGEKKCADVFLWKDGIQVQGLGEDLYPVLRMMRFGVKEKVLRRFCRGCFGEQHEGDAFDAISEILRRHEAFSDAEKVVEARKVVEAYELKYGIGPSTAPQVDAAQR